MRQLWWCRSTVGGVTVASERVVKYSSRCGCFSKYRWCARNTDQDISWYALPSMPIEVRASGLCVGCHQLRARHRVLSDVYSTIRASFEWCELRWLLTRTSNKQWILSTRAACADCNTSFCPQCSQRSQVYRGATHEIKYHRVAVLSATVSDATKAPKFGVDGSRGLFFMDCVTSVIQKRYAAVLLRLAAELPTAPLHYRKMCFGIWYTFFRQWGKSKDLSWYHWKRTCVCSLCSLWLPTCVPTWFARFKKSRVASIIN